MNNQTDIILEARGISKSFPGVKALDQVSLTLRRGRLTALLGENGAGKSTLMNILAGVFPPDQGEVRLKGRPVQFKSTREASLAGITMIFQELNLVSQLTVAENIFLGREPLNRLGFIDYEVMNQETSRLLQQLELDVSPNDPLGRLRVGQQQVVEIAKALSTDARVIIMDEPTSAISKHEIEMLFSIIADLKRAGVAIGYITHKLDELERIGEDAAVMRDGRMIGCAPLTELSHDAIVRMMIGRDVKEMSLKAPVAATVEVLRTEDLSLPHPHRPGDALLKDINLRVCRGEVLGLFGLMGAGRTELLETLFGLHPSRVSGTIFIDGRPADIASPVDAISNGLALAPEDRKGEGLVLEMTVAENASLASLPQVERFGLLNETAERRLVERSIARFQVKTSSLRQLIRNLSGGNQQKVILGKWLATNPKVLLLDEPTRGIDIHAKREIYTLIDELARGGLAVMVVSSELPEILTLADRIAVLCAGRKTTEFHRCEATEEKIMRAALPRIQVK